MVEDKYQSILQAPENSSEFKAMQDYAQLAYDNYTDEDRVLSNWYFVDYMEQGYSYQTAKFNSGALNEDAKQIRRLLHMKQTPIFDCEIDLKNGKVLYTNDILKAKYQGIRKRTRQLYYYQLPRDAYYSTIYNFEIKKVTKYWIKYNLSLLPSQLVKADQDLAGGEDM